MIDETKLIATPGTKISLNDFDTDFTTEGLTKKVAEQARDKELEQLRSSQDRLYASDKYAILIIFQAMDAAGKDSTIKYVMSGVNPQGCDVTSFKQPSSEELDHDFLWRTYKALPGRGKIGIFNRSYYEEVLVTKVHPQIITNQKLPDITPEEAIKVNFWEQRYDSINDMEKHLTRNGTVIIKFFLHVSKEEQRNRFLKRINRPDKNWKFSMNDITEREYWDVYQKAFEEAINHTSTSHAPWYIIPADHKWFMRFVVGAILTKKLDALDLQYPKPTEEQLSNLQEAKKILEKED